MQEQQFNSDTNDIVDTTFFDPIIPYIVEASRNPNGKTTITVILPITLSLDQDIIRLYFDTYEYCFLNERHYGIRHNQFKGELKDQNVANYIFLKLIERTNKCDKQTTYSIEYAFKMENK